MTYELYALRYAVSGHRGPEHNFMPVPGVDHHDGPMPLYFFVWAAVDGDRVVMVDGGASETTARARGNSFERSPADGLRDLGLSPGNVTDLVISHLHWDHAGNIGLFPDARIHVHPDEMAYATGASMTHPFLRRPFDADQVCDLVRATYDGRVEFTPGFREIAPGIEVHHLGGHTPGLQVVRVETARGPVVVASDAVHYYANAQLGIPFPVVVHVDDYMDAGRRVAELAGEPDRVIAGHDPAISSMYPRAIPDNELIVRLDVSPDPGLLAETRGSR